MRNASRSNEAGPPRSSPLWGRTVWNRLVIYPPKRRCRRECPPCVGIMDRLPLWMLTGAARDLMPSLRTTSTESSAYHFRSGTPRLLTFLGDTHDSIREMAMGASSNCNCDAAHLHVLFHSCARGGGPLGR